MTNICLTWCIPRLRQWRPIFFQRPPVTWNTSSDFRPVAVHSTYFNHLWAATPFSDRRKILSQSKLHKPRRSVFMWILFSQSRPFPQIKAYVLDSWRSTWSNMQQKACHIWSSRCFLRPIHNYPAPTWLSHYVIRGFLETSWNHLYAYSIVWLFIFVIRGRNKVSSSVKKLIYPFWAWSCQWTLLRRCAIELSHGIGDHGDSTSRLILQVLSFF